MPDAALPHLLSPLRIGSLEVRNRIVVPAHATRFEDPDGMPNARLRDYWLAKARGGAGLIITHGHGVTSPALHPQRVALERPEVVEAYAPIVAAVQAAGAPLLLQLNHLGGIANPRGTGGVTLGPSAVRAPGEVVAPVAMSVQHIRRIVDAYQQAARVARSAGFDGVEIMAEVSYLLMQFMSPVFNRRDDAYGGSLDNRLRLPREVIAAVRAGIGTDRALGLRISGDQLVPGGLGPAEMREIAPALEATGELDFLHVGAGPGAGAHVPPSYYPPGSLVYLTEEIREVTSLPLVISQRIPDPTIAEDVLARGVADLVSMNRALIADPELPQKLSSGREGEVRPCIACNECIGRFGDGLPVACSVNPDVGREGRGTGAPAARLRDVMVVGAGPAGLEAARVAALRGHRVQIFEREREVGGQLRLAAQAPLRDDLAKLVRYYERELGRLGVAVELDTAVDAAAVSGRAPDVVVIATGSRPLVPEVEIEPGAPVVDARDVLAGAASVGRHVAVIADDRHVQGLSTADWLAGRGHLVEVFTQDYHAGALLDQSTRNRLYDRLLRQGVRLVPLARVRAVSRDGLETVCAITREARPSAQFDTVVFACGGAADGGLARALDGPFEVHVIGDALSARRIIDAIGEGAQVGRSL